MRWLGRAILLMMCSPVTHHCSTETAKKSRSQDSTRHLDGSGEYHNDLDYKMSQSHSCTTAIAPSGDGHPLDSREANAVVTDLNEYRVEQ